MTESCVANMPPDGGNFSLWGAHAAFLPHVLQFRRAGRCRMGRRSGFGEPSGPAPTSSRTSTAGFLRPYSPGRLAQFHRFPSLRHRFCAQSLDRSFEFAKGLWDSVGARCGQRSASAA